MPCREEVLIGWLLAAKAGQDKTRQKERKMMKGRTSSLQFGACSFDASAMAPQKVKMVFSRSIKKMIAGWPAILSQMAAGISQSRVSSVNADTNKL